MIKLLALSEHYFPRFGGTVSYVHETLNALAALGVEAELLVPGPASAAALAQATRYRVTPVDADYPQSGDPSASQRLAFCAKANAVVLERMKLSREQRPDLVHVLFGLFLMEQLESEACRAAGVPVVATVHNLPPMECGRLLPDASLVATLKERFRLSAVGWRNARRIRRHPYDLVIVPSAIVATHLKRVLPGTPIGVIGHGPTTELTRQMVPPRDRRPAIGSPVRLLTAGGFVPHKRQHLIPEIASRLLASGNAVEWDLAGPPGRISGYFDAIRDDIARRGLADKVRLHPSPPFSVLARLYDEANLYVQPSTEEGFCLTALDAAAAGLAVIASPAGALPEIAMASGGRLVPSRVENLTVAITEFVSRAAWPNAVSPTMVSERFAWSTAAMDLFARYQALLSS